LSNNNSKRLSKRNSNVSYINPLQESLEINFNHFNESELLNSDKNYEIKNVNFSNKIDQIKISE